MIDFKKIKKNIDSLKKSFILYKFCQYKNVNCECSRSSMGGRREGKNR